MVYVRRVPGRYWFLNTWHDDILPYLEDWFVSYWQYGLGRSGIGFGFRPPALTPDEVGAAMIRAGMGAHRAGTEASAIPTTRRREEIWQSRINKEFRGPKELKVPMGDHVARLQRLADMLIRPRERFDTGPMKPKK